MLEPIQDWDRYYVTSSIRMLQCMIGQRPSELEDFESYTNKELEDIRDTIIKENKNILNL